MELNGTPVKALTGQISTHSLQSPHRLSTGSPVFNSASVNTVAYLILGPYSVDMRRQFFPIHPKPARFATNLWEMAPSNLGGLTNCEAGIGYALNPAF